MKRLSFLMLLVATLTLPFACSEPDNTGSGNGQEQEGNGNEDGGNEDGGNEEGGNEEGGNEVVTYKPGEYYKKGLAEGIVATVDESGEHGLLISIDETVAQWSTEYKMLTVMGGEFSMEDGASNCKYIREQENWEELYPAFAWCHAKNAPGLSSWYLPAIFELEYIYHNFEAINTTLKEMGETPLANGVNDSYWSSTELGVQGAYAFSFYEGEIASYDNNKLNQHPVRAVRKF
ncbi:MAG: DUF1566 domain-containing protein [Alistipes sp.]|nr:DUF1566 domain-containing protein [Alistipes sp.]